MAELPKRLLVFYLFVVIYSVVYLIELLVLNLLSFPEKVLEADHRVVHEEHLLVHLVLTRLNVFCYFGHIGCYSLGHVILKYQSLWREPVLVEILADELPPLPVHKHVLLQPPQLVLPPCHVLGVLRRIYSVDESGFALLRGSVWEPLCDHGPVYPAVLLVF